MQRIIRSKGANIPNSYKKAYKDLGVYSENAKKDMQDDADAIGDAHEKIQNVHSRLGKAFFPD